MTQQEQRQFTAVMQMIVPMVVDRMVKDYGMKPDDALRQLYRSKLYADLERESSKLWHLSPLALAQLWYEGKNNEHIHYPEEA
ncbi:MAG: hypothetical protein IKS36_07315 [Bacteroidales bacterium]|nr:hypothetical protein [Bacteroidales bacterium]MCR5065297.1 hypothetical protein [Bacteroidales bacterium]